MRVIVFSFLLISALTGCSRDIATAPVLPEAMASDSLQPLYVVTNRGRDAQGYFVDTRSESLSYLGTTVSLPPGRTRGDEPVVSTRPNPKRHFTIAAQSEYSSGEAFVGELRRALAELPPNRRNLTLFIHGYYNSYSDSIFRLAQAREDLGVVDVTVSFSWASSGQLFGYTHDRESVLYSRDHLEHILTMLSRAGANNLYVVGHSMGGLLLMETLRQIQADKPGWAKRNIDTAVLLSPDIAPDLFRQQAASSQPLPHPFFIVVSQEDKVLKLSSRLNSSGIRLGQASNTDDLEDFNITLIDVSDFSEKNGGNHYTALESSELLDSLSNVIEMNRIMDTERTLRVGGISANVQSDENAKTVRLTRDTPVEHR